MWLNKDDRIRNLSGWDGTVVEEYDEFVTVDFDNRQCGARFARDGDGLLQLI